MSSKTAAVASSARISGDDREIARLCKALAHPVRVRILRHLAGRDGCVCGEVVDIIGLAQSTVSEHLRILKAADLLSGEIDGPRVCYCVNPKKVERLRSLLGAF